MAHSSVLTVVSSGKKISVEQTAVMRGNKKAEQKDSRRRISCKDLGNGEYQGWLWCKKEKPGFGPNSWRKYWFMLKDKSLYCYKGPQDVVARRLYHLPAFVVSLAKETSRKYAFKISHASFGTVLFAAKDYTDMSNWMVNLAVACEEKSDRRKKSDESMSDISESENEEDNIEEEEKKSLQPVTEKDNETEDKDLAAPTTMCLSDSSSAAADSSSAATSSAVAAEIESMPLATEGPESHLLTSINSESDPVGSSIPESSKEESTPLAASHQEPSQLLCPQPESTSVHLTSSEPESSQHISEALGPAAVAPKKASGPATLSKPKPSTKSSPSGESSASPTLERQSLTRPTTGPATFAKPARTVPSTGMRSSTTDSPAMSPAPFAIARLAFETASSSKPLASVTGIAPSKLLLKTADADDGSAKTLSEMPSEDNVNTARGTGVKLWSRNNAVIISAETSTVARVPSLPGRAITEPARSASPSSAVSLARACSAAECSTTQLAASTINTKNVGPATLAKSASPRAVSESLPPSWTASGHELHSKRTASAVGSRATSSPNGDCALPFSEVNSNLVKSQSVQREETRWPAVTSLSDNEKQVLDILDVHLNSENLGSQTEDPSELTEGQMADTFQSAEPLPELSATKRARSRMTHIAKSMKLKAKQSPTNSNQDLCSRLLLLQRSFKDKMQELEILEELLKTPVMTSDRLKQFCHENRDFAKRLTENPIYLGESVDSLEEF